MQIYIILHSRVHFVRSSGDAQCMQPPHLLTLIVDGSFLFCLPTSLLWRINLNQPSSCSSRPVEMRINKHIQGDSLLACLWEQRLCLDWTGHWQMRLALKQQRPLIGWQIGTEAYFFLFLLWSRVFTPRPDATEYPTPVFHSYILFKNLIVLIIRGAYY